MTSAAPARETTAQSACLLSCPDDADTRADVEDLAVAACDEARKRNWKAWARWTDEGLKLWLQHGSAEEQRAFIDSLSSTARRYGATLSMLEEAPPAAIYDLERAPVPWGTVIHGRLTRELLCALPEGAYVASDSSCSECTSSLGRIGPFSVRAQQWQRAQLAGLDGCMCRVLWAEADFAAFTARKPRENDSGWL